MTYDELDRDIFASLGAYFQTVFAGRLPVFFESNHIDGKPANDYVEIRIDDLVIDEIAHEQYHVEVGVDLKIERTKTNDLFAIRLDTGKAAESLRQGVPLYHPTPDILVTGASPYVDLIQGLTFVDSIQNEVLATNVLMGCLSTQGLGGRRHKIETIHHGQLANKHILVSSVSTTLSILL